jgi:hypothetical protein
MPRSCPVCEAAVRLELTAGREATVGSVSGVIDQLPFARCEAGHRTLATASPTVTEDALLQVRRAVPHARARRLRRDEVCTSCGQPLTMPVRRTDWPVTLERPGGLEAVLTLRLDLPATRCPGCSTDHLPTRSQGDLESTVRELLAG